MFRYHYLPLFITLLLLVSCTSRTASITPEISPVSGSTKERQGAVKMASDGPATPEQNLTALQEVEFRLRTEIVDRRMVFVGVGGEIDKVVNPDLLVFPGDQVRLILENGDGIPHDWTVPEFNGKTPVVGMKEKSVETSFPVAEEMSGTYAYFCTLPGHRQAGQEGKFIVAEP
jgi:nitrite reductase (NO-forming)